MNADDALRILRDARDRSHLEEVKTEEVRAALAVLVPLCPKDWSATWVWSAQRHRTGSGVHRMSRRLSCQHAAAGQGARLGACAHRASRDLRCRALHVPTPSAMVGAAAGVVAR